MITLNTDPAFTQVKSIKTWDIYQANQNCTATEVIEMTRQDTIQRSSASYSMKRKSKVSKRMGSLSDFLLSAVDETVKQVFLEAGAEVIYDFLENKFYVNREEIATNPEDFSAGLERLLGSAAQMIEKLILESLYSKLQLKFEEKKSYEFPDYIKELKIACLKEK